jgi:REP element-mobilizing transposase RayT
VIFGTKRRVPLIAADLRSRLWSYMGGIARENDFRALCVGGMAEHAHALLSLGPAMPIAKAVQLIKAGSSLWMNETTGKNFEWQEGYAAFTVSLSNLDSVKRYIRNQEQHHRKIDFAEEWNLLLKKHGIVLPYR